MKARDLGVEDDPAACAIEDVAPYLTLTPRECYAHFLDVLRLSDHLMRVTPPAEWLKAWKAEDALNDPGRWWERVPSR